MNTWFVIKQKCVICGGEFTALSNKARYCDECRRKLRKKLSVARTEKKIETLLSKNRDEMSMSDHWVKAFFFENLKTMTRDRAFQEAIKRVRRIQFNNWKKINNLSVRFTKQEKKNIRQNSKRWFKSPIDKETQHEEQVLREFGY